MKNMTRSLTAGAAAALLLVAGAAMAATSAAQQRYQQERAACMSGASNQDRTTCLREAAAALQESRRGGLAGGSTNDLGANRMTRCARLPAADRTDCELRMSGQGRTSGSASQGGILRELETPVPAPASR